jgi:hypothetical protein
MPAATPAIRPGQRVLARTSADRLLVRTAATEIVDGQDFPVVWVCREEEWERAQREQCEPDAVPWPASEVRAADQLPV